MIEIRRLRASDAPPLATAFSAIGWDKPEALFLAYVEEERAGRRAARVAVVDDEPAGYITVQWSSEDPSFAERGVPEIKDLNVLPCFRGEGVGSELLGAAEELIAERSSVAGIRVGLHAGYGAAQRLYVRRGYVPDGSGAVDAAGRAVPEGARVSLDDEVTLRLYKTLAEPRPSAPEARSDHEPDDPR